jgi:hypothetical protein
MAIAVAGRWWRGGMEMEMAFREEEVFRRSEERFQLGMTRSIDDDNGKGDGSR